MTRPFNKFREVDYLNDGVSRYQCLSCKETWDARSTPGPFCSYCGTRWEGEFVWRTEARQEQDRVRQQAAYRHGQLSPQMLWVLQARCIWEDLLMRDLPEVLEWKDEPGWTFQCTTVGARQAFKILQDRRKEREDYDSETFRVEYRLVLRPDPAARMSA